MVVEYIRYAIDDARAQAFEQAYRRSGEAVGPFVHDIEEMRHYQVTVSSER